MTVFASIQDFGGDMRGRPFPICFYTGVPSGHWPGPTSDRLAAAARVVRDLLALRRDVTRFLNSPGHFDAIFGEREVDLEGLDGDSQDSSWILKARTVRLGDWFAGAEPVLKVHDPVQWFSLVADWGGHIKGMESKSFEPTLRFPMAKGVGWEVQIAGWLHWLGARMDLKRRFLSFAISGQPPEGPGHFSVVTREVAPQDFLLMTDGAGTHPYLDDLSATTPAGGDSADAQTEGAAPPASAFDGSFDPETTWADFALGGRSAPS